MECWQTKKNLKTCLWLRCNSLQNDSWYALSITSRLNSSNVLHEQGNLYLTAYPHFTAVKDVDTESQRVTYFIPKVEFDGRKRVVVHTYEEPLIHGHNDNPYSFKRLLFFSQISDRDVRQKIKQVRKAYRKMNGDPQTIRDFYKESGIEYAENKPLRI